MSKRDVIWENCAKFDGSNARDGQEVLALSRVIYGEPIYMQMAVEIGRVHRGSSISGNCIIVAINKTIKSVDWSYGAIVVVVIKAAFNPRAACKRGGRDRSALVDTSVSRGWP